MGVVADRGDCHGKIRVRLFLRLLNRTIMATNGQKLNKTSIIPTGDR